MNTRSLKASSSRYVRVVSSADEVVMPQLLFEITPRNWEFRVNLESKKEILENQKFVLLSFYINIKERPNSVLKLDTSNAQILIEN